MLFQLLFLRFLVPQNYTNKDPYRVLLAFNDLNYLVVVLGTYLVSLVLYDFSLGTFLIGYRFSGGFFDHFADLVLLGQLLVLANVYDLLVGTLVED